MNCGRTVPSIATGAPRITAVWTPYIVRHHSGESKQTAAAGVVRLGAGNDAPQKPGEVRNMSQDEQLFFMNEALKLAEKAAELGEAPAGAVIVYNGEIIARGYNTREKDQVATGHAEIMAIREASKVLGSWRLIDCDLYVTLEPCLMCAGAIIQARLKRVFFGAFDPKSGMAGSVANVFLLPANHRVEVTGGILEEPCGDILRSFFSERRKKTTPE